MDELMLNELEKIAQSTSSTAIEYETTSPVKGVIFRAQDIVAGGGYLTSGGKKFKPKTWKGHSLSNRVTGKGFGKVRVPKK